jgi:hypothetical protein
LQRSRVIHFLVATIFAASSYTPLCRAAEEPNHAANKTAASGVEEIYVVRSWRESRAPATEFCAPSHTNFDNITSEDHYTFRSISIQTSSGRIVDNNVKTVGRLRACFGSTADPKLQNFYAEGALGETTFTGRGECIVYKEDYPEPGIVSLRCFLHFSGLPSPYLAGELTTNSIRSRNVLGGVSDPSGYTQPSIATIRLWRKRPEK